MNVIRDFAAHIADTIEELLDYQDYSIEINDGEWTYKLSKSESRFTTKITDILGNEPLDYETMVDKLEEFINNEWEDNIGFECVLE